MKQEPDAMPIDTSNKSDDYYRLFAFGDRHAPFQDRGHEDVLLDMLRDIQPDIVLEGGDMISADCLSKYPKEYTQLAGLQDELDQDFRWRTRINTIVPRAKKILLRDNHFYRRLTDRRRDNHWLHGLKSCDPYEMLRVHELGWEYVRSYKWRDVLLFVHGDDAYYNSSANPVNRVRNISKATGMSIIRFHSHTTGLEVFRTGSGAERFAIQLGCFQDLAKADYISHPELANWTSSAGLFYLHKEDPVFLFVPIVFVGRRAVLNGKVYESMSQ